MLIDLGVEECEKVFEAVVRLKFDDDADVPGPYFSSPFVASALTKMLTALMQEAENSGDHRSVDAWTRWSSWKNRSRERRLLIQRVAMWELWGAWNSSERANAIRHSAAPFLLSDADVDDLVVEIDSLRSRDP